MRARITCVLLSALLCPIGVMGQAPPTTAEATRAVSEVYEGLPRFLKISWREGPEYPMGIQDSGFAVLDEHIVSAGGFSRQPKDVVAKYADAFDGQPHGFTKMTFLLDPRKPDAGWGRIADVPGPPRQAAAAAVVRSDFYLIGGFSYSEPRSYTSTYRLRTENGGWKWERLGCELPWPVCEAATAVVGNKIYLVGGADFHATPATPDGAFSSASGRTGDPVGRCLLMLDTRRIEAGWQRLADCPGSPRFFTSAAAAGGKVYALGGIHNAPRPTDHAMVFHNVIDSWVYDPPSAQWSRLPDVPHGTNRRVVPFKDRYLIMLGGYRYSTTWNVDGTVTEAFRPREKALAEMKDHVETTVLVFDTTTNQIGTADPLLDRTSWPMAAVCGDSIYALGGEGGYRLWHPATLQIGKIETIRGNE